MKNPGPCRECLDMIRKENAKNFYALCPSCGKKATYKYTQGVSRIKKIGPRYCRRCCQYKQIAIAHGITVKEVIQSIPKFKRYSNWVRTLTKQQPVYLLENYNKRGIYSYHIDHKMSIWNGFLNKIPAEQIANISNLQMLWWKDNLRKGSK